MSLKIHWHSNSPWTPTGYGNQSKLFLWRIQALGHKVSMTAFYGLQGSPLQINGIDIFPAGIDGYGNDVLAADAEHVGADIVITLIDAWVFNPMVTGKVNWYPWLPIDHDPIPPAVVSALATAKRPIAYSRFGEQKLREAGFNPLYVPHGTDTQKAFYPVDRAEARKFLNVPEHKPFVVGMVAHNKGQPSRKAFDQHIRAFAEFKKSHPDAMLYIHTDWTGHMGEDISAICALNGLQPTDVAQPPMYRYMRGLLGDEYMRNAYNAMDVYFNCVKGGGFEIGLIEAQACGTPVITTDATAMPELVRAGWKVPPADKFFSQNSYQFVPSVPEMVRALESAYEKRGDTVFRQAARDAMVADYDADVVTEKYWKPVLEQIEAEVKGAKVAVSAAREARAAKRAALKKPALEAVASD